MAFAQSFAVQEVYLSPIQPAASEVGGKTWLASKLHVQATKTWARGRQRDGVQFGTEVDLEN